MTVCVLDKKDKELWLHQMFDLLYENMREIAPSGIPYEQERQEFVANVGLALEKAPRQVLLAIEDGILVGYIQYYTRGALLMVEEMQIRREHRGSLLFLRLCRHLLDALPAEIKTVEAYADPRNEKSRRMMARVGMEELAEEGPYVHLRGDAEKLRRKFVNRG